MQVIVVNDDFSVQFGKKAGWDNNKFKIQFDDHDMWVEERKVFEDSESALKYMEERYKCVSNRYFFSLGDLRRCGL